jgi:hypothetical protein
MWSTPPCASSPVPNTTVSFHHLDRRIFDPDKAPAPTTGKPSVKIDDPKVVR